MDLGLDFDDSDFERKRRITAGTKTSYNAKIVKPLWFEEEPESDSDPTTFIHQQKYSADYHFYKEKYEIAVTKYSMLLERIPESNMPLRQDVQESLCRSYLNLGKHQESTEIAYSMVEMMRSEDEARQRQTLILLSEACKGAGDWAGCVRALGELISGQSQFASFWTDLGRAYHLQQGQPQGEGDADHRTVTLQALTCFVRARVLLESVQNTAVKASRERNEAMICKINEEIMTLGVEQELIDHALEEVKYDLGHSSATGDDKEQDNDATASATSYSPEAFRKRWFSWIDRYHDKT